MRKFKQSEAGGTADHPALFSPEGFARSIGVSRATIYRAMKSGELKAKKLGRLTKIERSAGQAYIDALPAR